MELKDFIKTTLIELSSAIDEAGVELHKKVAITNVNLRTKGYGDYGLVDFDLAIASSDSSTNHSKGGASIQVLKASLGTSNEHTSGTVSRIKFTIQADFSSFDKPHSPIISK